MKEVGLNPLTWACGATVLLPYFGKNTKTMEQHTLDTHAGKQLP